MTFRAETGTDSALAARLAAIASIGAALIHVAVIPPHWREWLPSGLFFASMAVFQVIWALAAWTRPTGPLLGAGILANAGCAVLWVWSRTTGVPFGPHAGVPETVQAADICALLLQCYVVMGAGWAWLRGYRQESVSGLSSALVLLGANTVILAAVTAGIASTLVNPEHHAVNIDHHAPVEAQSPAANNTVGAHHHDE